MRETIVRGGLSILLLLCTGFAKAQATGGKLIYCRNRTLYAVSITPSGELQPGKTPHKIIHLPNGTALDSITVSADGNLIVFGTRSSNKDIYSTSEDDESFTLWTVEERRGARLRRQGQGFCPCFSPSGSQFVYAGYNASGRGDTSTYIVDLTTGKKRLLRSMTTDPFWSASGDEITLIDESKRDFDKIVMVVDAATGKQVRFQKSMINAHTPLLSPNGHFLAYNPHLSRPKVAGIIEDRKTGHTIELPLAGEPVLAWSADSRLLLWTRFIISPGNEGAVLWNEIWTTATDSEQSHRIGAGASACFAPDGRHVIYLRTQADSNTERLGLYIADLHNHRHRLLPDCDNVFMVWKPNQRLDAANASRKTGYAAWKR